MTASNSFSFLSSDGITDIYCKEWIPEEKPKAVLQIAYGVAEYIERYDDFASFLAENNIAVVGNDHLGHGKSVAEGRPNLFFSEKDGWDKAVSDIHTLREKTKEKFPDVPYFIMGHSMGSFLTRTYLIKYPGDVDGAIIMGTGRQSKLMIFGGKLMGKIIGMINGLDKPDDNVTKAAFGGYNKVIKNPRTPFDWLSVNEENVDAYIASPFCSQQPTVGLFYDMLCGIEFICRQKNVNKMDVSKPVLFISGAEDPVGENGKGVKASFESFRKAGVKDLELILYPVLRHEILNEKCKEEVYKDILAWIEKRI